MPPGAVYTRRTWGNDAPGSETSAANFNRMEDGIESSGVLAVVTAFPANPVEGQVCDFLVDATNGIVWRFKYRGKNPDNSNNASAYKWEFVGGPPLLARVDTNGVRQSATFGDLNTADGPQIVLPAGIGGDFLTRVSCRCDQPVGEAYMGVNINGAGAATTESARMWSNSATFNNVISIAGTALVRRNAVAAGATFRCVYNGNANSWFGSRHLEVLPVRCG